MSPCSIGIFSFQSGFKYPCSSTNFFLRPKLWKIVMKVVITSTQAVNWTFWVVVRIYEIHVFDEAFLPLYNRCYDKWERDGF